MIFGQSSVFDKEFSSEYTYTTVPKRNFRAQMWHYVEIIFQDSVVTLYGRFVRSIVETDCNWGVVGNLAYLVTRIERPVESTVKPGQRLGREQDPGWFFIIDKPTKLFT